MRDPVEAREADWAGEVRVGASPDIVSSEKVRSFHHFWLSRCRGGRLPAKSDMDPVEMAPFLSSLVLLRLHRDPLDFEYRVIGEDIVSRLGNMTGRRVRDAALVNVKGSAYQNYCAVVAQRAPQFLEGTAITAFRADRPFLISRVHCPLATDGETVDHIISCMTFL
jgi:hypothetical protein